MLNEKGLRFILDRSSPLHVDTMNAGVDIIADYLRKQPPTEGYEAYARHLLWLVGFDTLIADRGRIHDLIEKVV